MKKKMLQDLHLDSIKATLHAVPSKEKGDEMPKTNVYEKNGTHQADLLFLPKDNGFSYALVVVDLHTGLTDARAIKSKKPEEVKSALQSIYASNILKFPARMETDPGSEFKGAFKKLLEDKGIELRYGKAGRHRQQAVVEQRNGVIGEALNLRMSALEQLSGATSRHWVDYLPTVITALNNNLPKKSNVDRADSGKFPFEIGNKDILQEGTKVRVPLEEPKDFVSGKRLHGKFRAGDQRWDEKVRTIRQVLARPDQPIMYLVNLYGSERLEKVGYTRKQLQVVQENEAEPDLRLKPAGVEFETYNVHSLQSKKIENGQVKYLVRWVGYPNQEDWTWEPASSLKKNPRLLKAMQTFQTFHAN